MVSFPTLNTLVAFDSLIIFDCSGMLVGVELIFNMVFSLTGILIDAYGYKNANIKKICLIFNGFYK